MKIQTVNSKNAPSPSSGYSQAVLVEHSKRVLYVSGQIPVHPDGTTPESFIDQAEQAWANVEAQLIEAGMELDNIIKHTTFLADRRYTAQNSEIRRRVFGKLEPALTVIITGIFDEAWLLEIEAIAMD